MKTTLKPAAPGGDILSIQMLRGIASLMVCLFHLTCGDDNMLPDTAPLKWVGKWGWMGVEIFFIISGFVIPYSMYVKNYSIRDFPTFLKKRIVRIEPPYLLSIVLILLLNYISTFSPYYKGTGKPVDWVNVAGHLAYLNAFTHQKWLNNAFWTLAVEFQYYFLIAVAFSWVSSSRRIFRVLFFALFLVSSIALSSYGRLIFFYSPFFLIGILVFQLLTGIIEEAEFLLLLGLALVVVYHEFFGLVMATVCVATVLVILYVRKVPRLFLYLGTISYSLYLLHNPIGGRIVNICKNFVHGSLLLQGVVVMALILCLTASALYYRFIEKYFKSLAAAIRYKQRKRVITSLAEA